MPGAGTHKASRHSRVGGKAQKQAQTAALGPRRRNPAAAAAADHPGDQIEMQNQIPASERVKVPTDDATLLAAQAQAEQIEFFRRMLAIEEGKLKIEEKKLEIQERNANALEVLFSAVLEQTEVLQRHHAEAIGGSTHSTLPMMLTNLLLYFV